jgi:hypothetical protein
MFGFCNIASIPVRAAASHRAEMVTQLLFGEAYRIVDYQHTLGWAEIETQYDDYQGFIDINQIALMHQSAYQQYEKRQWQTAPAPMMIFDKKRNFAFPISAGSTLLLNEENVMRLGAEVFEIQTFTQQGETDIRQIALSFLNTPYLWGGRTMYGIDCSGFTQIVFKIMGKSLPRDASQQAVLGEKITSLAQTQCGDLAFFQNKDGRITHTGLILQSNKVTELQSDEITNQQKAKSTTNNQINNKSTNPQIHKSTIIHASGKVRIDLLDEQGIFCLERNEYSHALHSVIRVK